MLRTIFTAAFALAFAQFSFLASIKADIIITGDVVAGTGQLTITEDIVYNITADGDAHGVAFDAWTNATTPHGLGIGGPALAISINGGPDVSRTSSFLTHVSANLGDVTAEDSLLHFDPIDPISVVAGDTFTLKAGVFDIVATGTPLEPELLNNPFTGNSFVIGGNTGVDQLSGFTTVGVPEPSSIVAMAIGIAGVLVKRRRKQIL